MNKQNNFYFSTKRILLVLLFVPFLFGSLIFAKSPDGVTETLDENVQKPIAQLVDDFTKQVGTAAGLYPKEWTPQLHATDIDVNFYAKTDLENARAYGALAHQLANCTFTKSKEILLKQDGFLELLKKVKSLTQIKKLQVSPQVANEISIQTEIRVPVVANFHTQVALRSFAINENKQVLEWRQINGTGELSYNHGVLVLEPNGQQSQVTVLGIHIINQTNKVPWIGRATARSFATTHYGNFIKAFKDTVEPQCTL